MIKNGVWATSPDMIKSKAEWADDKKLMLDCLDYDYKKYADAWKDACDDRYLVFTTYHMIVDAINSIKAPINTYVIIALRKHIKKDEELMDGIIKRFTEGV